MCTKSFRLVLLAVWLAGLYHSQAFAQGGWRQWDIYLRNGDRVEANPLSLTHDGRFARSLKSDASPGAGIERSQINYLAARGRDLPPAPVGDFQQDLVILVDGKHSFGPVTFKSIRFSEGTILQLGVEINLKDVAYIKFASPPRDANVRAPSRGSAERKAILDALRAEMKRLHQADFIFTVNYLKVQRGWAWIEVAPRSADGTSNFENVSALMRKRGNRWKVAEVACAEEGNPDCLGHADFFRRLRKKFPAAPRGIFP